MDATVTVEFTLKNVCNEGELEASDYDFESLVRGLIDTEGLLSLCCDGTLTIVAIEQV